MNNDFAAKESEDLQSLINICHINIKNSAECMEYLNYRGITNEYIKKYQIGYFPQNIDKLSEFVSRTTMEKINIIDYSGNSKFSEYFYLIFPIFSEYKIGVGIGGRTLLSEDKRASLSIPKYENSSFKKAQVLFGLSHSRGAILKKRNAYITEGYFDQIAFDAAGIKNSVAICGTAFSRYHFLRLAKYTNKLTFVLDRDDGGRKSMERISTKFMNQGMKLSFKLLPDGSKDVDEYFSAGGTKESFVNDLKTFIPEW